MPTRDKRSRTWQYFDISNENKKMAVCLLCQMQISRGGVGKKAGTSAMSNHLKSKHPDKSNEICKTKSPTLFLPSPAADPLPGPSSSLTSTQKLLSLSESFEQKILQDVNGTKAKKYHYLITEMIALDNEPLSVVERVGFSRLMKQAVPHYEVPSRTYITQKILPDVYNRIHAKIATHLSTALAISVTSDVWMCIHNNATFLSFTAHWLSTEFQLEHAFLGIKPFPRSHTGENIAKELDTIAARWNIHQSKIHLLIHDSDANMVNDVRMAEYDSARCFIHSLQRVVTESLKVQHEVVEMIAAGRHLVMHFNHSSLAQDKLMELQKELNLPQHQLVQDINTRWNSTYYMKERLLEQKQAISVYVADHDTLNLNNLTAQQWDLMEQCIKVLKPFEEITKMTSSGLSCISEVIPHVAALKKYLDKNEIAQISPDLPYMRTSLRAEIERCFSILEQDQNYLIATFLDPRFKTNYLGAVEAERARQIILSEYLKKSCDDSPTSERDSPSSSPVKSRRIDEAGSTVTREARDTFWNCFDEIANENSGQCQDQEKSAIANEIEYYLKTVCLDRSSDPYLWWSVNAKQYPNLTKFARIYLSAPCSSVYSERLFSEPGLVYENKRNRLLATNTENIVFIHHNLPLVNFEY